MHTRFRILLMAAILVMWMAWLANYWPLLPETIPTHFNAAGEADGWGGRGTIWSLPVIAVLTTLLVSVLPRWLPKAINYPVRITEENQARQYQWVLLFLDVLAMQILGLFAYISWMSVAMALPEQLTTPPNWGMWVGLALMFSWIFYYLWRSHQMR